MDQHLTTADSSMGSSVVAMHRTRNSSKTPKEHYRGNRLPLADVTHRTLRAGTDS